MPNRLLKETLRTSKKVNALSDFQFRVWVYLITYVDDYGRGSADPELLKGFVFPRKKGITEQQIADALSSLANSGMINLYEVEGESYFCFPNWEKHQQIRAKKSKFPAPASNGYQMISDDIKCPRNPIQSNTNTESIYENTNARAREEEKDRFEEFWAAYPRKSGDIKQAYFEYLGVIQSGVDEQTLIDAVKWQAEEKGRYMPNAEKWLRNMGWTEQKQEPKQKSSGRNDPAACNWTQEEQSAAIAQMMKELDALGDKI